MQNKSINVSRLQAFVSPYPSAGMSRGTPEQSPNPQDDPIVSPETDADIIESDTNALRHPVAKMAGIFLLTRKFLPDSVFLWAVRKTYRIDK